MARDQNFRVCEESIRFTLESTCAVLRGIRLFREQARRTRVLMPQLKKPLLSAASAHRYDRYRSKIDGKKPTVYLR